MSNTSGQRPDDTGRDRGILTEADREFLLGEKDDLQPQSKREARQRIRNRLENAILDLSLLSRALEDDDREMVADPVFPDSSEGNLRLTHVCSLFYHMIVDTSGDTERSIERFENSLGNSIESSLKRIEDNMLINVEANLAVERLSPNVDSLLDKYESNEETLDELMYLQKEGEIEMDQQYFTHMLERLWQSDKQFGFSSPSGEMNMLDPDDYEEMDNFIQEALDKMEVVFQEIDGRESTYSDK